MPEFREVIIAVISGLVAGAPLLTIFLYFRNRTDTNVRNLKTALKTLRDDKIKSIETKIELHFKEDKSQQILTELKHLTSQMSSVSNKLDNAREENSEQRADIKNNRGYVESVSDSLQTHIREPHHGK